MGIAAGPPLEATAVVLAGGRSSRFGQDKATVLVEGRPLIETVLDQLKPLSTEVISSSDSLDRYSHLDHRVVVDRASGRGPLMGIAMGLRAATYERVFVVACDTPVIEPGLVRDLADAARHAECAVPILDGVHPEPLFAVYCKAILPIVEEILEHGTGAPHELYSRVATRTLTVADGEWYTNLNTRAELDQYLAKRRV